MKFHYLESITNLFQEPRTISHSVTFSSQMVSDCHLFIIPSLLKYVIAYRVLLWNELNKYFCLLLSYWGILHMLFSSILCTAFLDGGQLALEIPPPPHSTNFTIYGIILRSFKNLKIGAKCYKSCVWV